MVNKCGSILTFDIWTFFISFPVEKLPIYQDTSPKPQTHSTNLHNSLRPGSSPRSQQRKEHEVQILCSLHRSKIGPNSSCALKVSTNAPGNVKRVSLVCTTLAMHDSNKFAIPIKRSCLPDSSTCTLQIQPPANVTFKYCARTPFSNKITQKSLKFSHLLM